MLFSKLQWLWFVNYWMNSFSFCFQFTPKNFVVEPALVSHTHGCGFKPVQGWLVQFHLAISDTSVRCMEPINRNRSRNNREIELFRPRQLLLRMPVHTQNYVTLARKDCRLLKWKNPGCVRVKHARYETTGEKTRYRKSVRPTLRFQTARKTPHFL